MFYKSLFDLTYARGATFQMLSKNTFLKYERSFKKIRIKAPFFSGSCQRCALPKGEINQVSSHEI